DNPKLKTVRKLETRRQRDKLGLFVAEGEDLVSAALEGGWELEFALVDAARATELLVRAEEVASQLLAEVSTLGHAPRVIGVFRAARPEKPLPALGLELWRVGDPGNVGTLARFVLGSEREGLPQEVVAACAATATIPLAGPAESLNVAMAGTIALYEWRRSRGEDDPHAEDRVWVHL